MFEVFIVNVSYTKKSGWIRSLYYEKNKFCCSAKNTNPSIHDAHKKNLLLRNFETYNSFWCRLFYFYNIKLAFNLHFVFSLKTFWLSVQPWLCIITNDLQTTIWRLLDNIVNGTFHYFSCHSIIIITFAGKIYSL